MEVEFVLEVALLLESVAHWRMKPTEASSAFLQALNAAKHVFFKSFMSDCAVLAEQVLFFDFAVATASAAFFQHSQTAVLLAPPFTVILKHFAFVFWTFS